MTPNDQRAIHTATSTPLEDVRSVALRDALALLVDIGRRHLLEHPQDALHRARAAGVDDVTVEVVPSRQRTTADDGVRRKRA
jgi:hypothetical protein